MAKPARGMWIGWQAKKLANNPGPRFEEAGGAAVEQSKDYQKRNTLVVASGNRAGDLHFDDLGYADEAIKSYQLFTEMKAAGKIGEAVRFQISLPAPTAWVTAFIAESDQSAVDPAMEAGILRELERIVGEIP